MANNVLLGKEVDSGKEFRINLDDIIEDRALLQANSRGGKSYLIRKLCEMIFGLVQIILIEPEGEYYTLREKYDFLLIGNKNDGADIQVSPKIAELLATKLLESGTSAIIDLSELLTPDKIKFVKLFADKLANESDKRLWHPVVVIIDEAHIFAPEKGQGEAESLNAVMALASKGGKRGYALVAATQRPSKLSKNVTNELNTKFIGRAGSYDDIQRAKQELGLPKSTPDSMFKIKHEFYAIGPGIDGIVRMKADLVQTTHKTNHLNYKITVSTPQKIRNNLQMFENIPEQAEQELNTKEALIKKNKELNDVVIVLRANLAHEQATKSPFAYDPKKLQEEYDKGFKLGKEVTRRIYEKKIKEIQVDYVKLINGISTAKNSAESLIKSLPLIAPVSFKVDEEVIDAPKEIIFPNKTVIPGTTVGDPVVIGETSKGGAMRMLKTLASFYPNEISQSRLCLLSKLSPSSGSTATYLSELRTKGYLESINMFHKCTPLGFQAAGDFSNVPKTHKELLEFWLSYLSGKEKNILFELCEYYPNSLSKEELASKAGISPTSGSYATYLSKLNTTGLIIKTLEGYQASKDLFPERK